MRQLASLLLSLACAVLQMLKKHSQTSMLVITTIFMILLLKLDVRCFCKKMKREEQQFWCATPILLLVVLTFGKKDIFPRNDSPVHVSSSRRKKETCLTRTISASAENKIASISCIKYASYKKSFTHSVAKL